MKIHRRIRLILVLAASLATLPAGALSFTYQGSGLALPSQPPAPNACPPPNQLPLNCDILALGTATATSGIVLPPWQFSSNFRIDAAFAITGFFAFDDVSAANNDFSGSITGTFDPQTFSSVIDYLVLAGSGIFAGARVTGSGVVQIIPPAGATSPPTYVEFGQFVIPEPSTAALLLVATLMATIRRRASGSPRDVPRPPRSSPSGSLR